MKSFSNYIAEGKVASFNNWKVPDEDSLKLEYQIEYTIKPLSNMGYWPTYDDFRQAVAEAEVVSISPEEDDQIAYRSNTKSFDDLLGLIKGYASYPKYRNEKTLKAIYDGFKSGKPMKYPIVIDLGKGRKRVFSGNTRMDIARQLGVPLKVLLIKPSGT